MERASRRIRAEIAKVDDTFVYRGHMLLGEENYKLVDINLTQPHRSQSARPRSPSGLTGQGM